MKRRKEKASVSFHYLEKQKKNGDSLESVPFTLEEFQTLEERVANQPAPDLENEGIFNQVRNGLLVPFQKVQSINKRTFAGQFKVPYSGHSFFNSEKGKIAAESLNQRDFHFVAYLSDDGRIFIGAQYLGPYGGYETLRWGLARHLPSKEGVRSFSFRRDLFDPGEVNAKEVRINVSQKSTDLHHDNSLTSKTVIVLKRESRKDTQFAEAVRRDVIPILAADSEDKRGRLAKVLSDTGLISVDDADIDGGVIIADVGGYEKRFNFIGDSSFATRFTLDVEYNSDGHPEPTETVQKILERLDHEIIATL